MKIRYLLKKRFKKGSPNPIYLALYLNDQTELIYTKERILVKDWSKEDSLPKAHTSDVFSRIEKVKVAVQKIMKWLEVQDKPVTPYTVKHEYLESQRKKASDQLAVDKNSKQGQSTITSLIDRWIENDLFKYKPSTRKTVVQSLGQFKLYLKASGQSTLERKHLDGDVIRAYERYLQEKKRLSNSTHGRTMKHLRWFLKTLNYDVHTISIRTHKKDIVALTLEELKALEEVDVSYNNAYQRAKDMFLLGTNTGLRISDLKRLNETRIIDNKICMRLQKNKKEVSIPLLHQTRKILETYGMAAPKISEQHLNKDIKEVCRLANINKLLTVKTNKAGLDVEKLQPKHELITSHTSSKTFITLAPKRFGMTPAEIASIVGKDLKTLINHYFQLPQESAMQKMVKADKRNQTRAKPKMKVA